jgi:uncharacterized protein (TIGR00730 family)
MRQSNVKGHLQQKEQKMKKISVCVYCGSRNGKTQAYEQAAKDLGVGIGTRKWQLVYGAGNTGLMGTVARAARASDAQVFGVIPTHLLKAEVGKIDLSSFIVTENMHERKKVMFMNCSAIVLLPGGAGSLDEFFEVLTWAQLALHDKPIVIVNVQGYWEPLLNLIDHMIEQDFADTSLREFFHVANSTQEALDYLEDRLP